MRFNINLNALNGREEFLASGSQPLAAPRAAIIALQEFFGVNEGIPTRYDEWASPGYFAIAHPLMLHIAEADGFVLPEKQARVHAGLGSHPRVTIFDDAGLDHGFAAQMGARRLEEGAQLADTRTKTFFAEHLQ